MITTNPDYNLDEILPKLKAYTVTDVVKTDHVTKNMIGRRWIKLHY